MKERTGFSTETDELWILERRAESCRGTELGELMSALFEAGARDVFFAPIKGIPEYEIFVLCKEEELVELDRILQERTGAIADVRRNVKREFLRRRFLRVATAYGEAAVKVCMLPDGREVFYPEYEDVKTLAGRFGRSYREIFEQTRELAQRTVPEES